MKAGHATPQTNTVLSDCLSGWMCRPPPTALQCTQRQQPRREHNNLPTSLLFFFPSAWLSRPICAIRERCQSAQVLCMLCVSLCECVMLIWTHIFTLLISLPLHFLICLPGHECGPAQVVFPLCRPTLCFPSRHLLARLLERLFFFFYWQCIKRADNDCNVCEQDKHA